MKAMARDGIGEPAGQGRFWLWCWLLTLLVTVPLGFGCADQSGRVAVQGKVTVAGQPVPTGSITFVPTDGNAGPSAGAAIENGQYSIPAKLGPVAGWNRIETVGTRKTGRQVPGPDPKVLIDEVESVVPARYGGAESPLKREIKAGQGDLDFEAEAK